MSRNYLDRDDRWTGFPKLINKFRYKIGIEIGVAFGEYSEHLLMFSDLELLYGLDHNPVKEEMNRLETSFRPRFKSIAGRSPNYADNFPNEYFDFVYIDAGHDEASIRRDLNTWFWKVKEGGLICGDDFLATDKDHPEGEFWIHIIVPDFCERHKLEYYVTGCSSAKEEKKQEYAKDVWNKLKKGLHQGHKTIQIPQWWIIK